MQFRTKTILGVALIEMALLAFLVGSVLSILRDSNEAELVRRIQLGGRLLAAAAKDAVISQDLSTLDSLVEEAMGTEQIDAVRILDANDVVLVERGDKKLLQRRFKHDEHLDDVTDGYFDWVTPVLAGGMKHGQIEIAVSTAPLDLLLQSARRWAASIAGLEMVLVAIFSWLLGSYLVRQLKELRDASFDFADGDFTRRIKVKGNDELAQTAVAFNLMAQQISDSHRQLQLENEARLKAQQSAELAQSRAEDRNEQLNGIFALSPDGFVSFDRNHCVKYASPAFTRLTGLQLSEVSGMSEVGFSDWLAQVCSREAPFPGVADLRAAQSAERAAPTLRQQFEVIGTVKRILEVGLRESSSASVSQILYFRDVTHEAEIDYMKSEFLSTAAHELRTPMASVFGYSELMLNHEFSEAERHEFLGIIYKQSTLMNDIINELLDLSRIESRRGKDFNMAMLEVCGFATQVAARFMPPVGRVAPQVMNHGVTAMVFVDANKIEQALGNVLSNAYKYSPQGGEVTLAFIVAEDEQTIGIRITDHGIGMTPAQQARVFERFYRADTSGKIPGTGLGMSIVKEIVGLHGGHVQIESELGQGTQVTVWLPINRDPVVEQAARSVDGPAHADARRMS